MSFKTYIFLVAVVVLHWVTASPGRFPNNEVQIEHKSHITYCPTQTNGVCVDGTKLGNICLDSVECRNGKWQIPENLQFKSKCIRCWVYNDPHFHGFMGNWYNIHELGDFAIAQVSDLISASNFIDGKFVPCVNWPGNTCMGKIWYKVQSGPVITFGPSNQNHDGGKSDFKLTINGTQCTIPSTGTVLINSEEVVLAWRLHGADSNCFMILENKGFMIKVCDDVWSMYIWAPPIIKSNVFGLCNHVDSVIRDKLYDRINGYLAITRKNRQFASSWKFPFVNGRKRRGIENETACNENEDVLANYIKVCKESIKAELPNDMMENVIKNCAFDRCIITEAINSGINGSYPDPDDWLNLAVKGAESQAAILKNTINSADSENNSKEVENGNNNVNVNVHVSVH